MNKMLLLIPTVIFCFTTLTTAAQKKNIEINGTRYKLHFKDEFKGKKVNEKVWQYRTDSKHLSTQLPENVEVKGGFLYLNVKKQKAGDKEYTGAGLITFDSFSHGYYEARFKVPAGAGWHTSFWLQMYDGQGTGTGKTVSEIDIFENDSRNKNFYGVNYHYWQGKKSFGHKNITTPDLSADFHVVACEYFPNKINYYFDGKLVQTIDSLLVKGPYQQIWLTTIGSLLGGTTGIDDSQLPSAAIFDYVRFYKRRK